MAHGVSIGLHLSESYYINSYIYGHASTHSGHPPGNHGDLSYSVSGLVYDSTEEHEYGRLIPSRPQQTLGSSQACSLRGIDRPLYFPYSFPLEDLNCDFYAISC